ncbi:MAG TPA: hypothetical protein VNI77_11415 [Nitrososphaera sp.]|nr:hypothetical protein [Nitrososphaera sp.]
MPAEDRNLIADFYTKVFDWKTEQLGKDMQHHVLATTTETDGNSRPKEPWAINCGFFQKTGSMPTQYPSVVIAAEDIKSKTMDAEQPEGKVLEEPMNIPGVGLYVSLLHTEGNRIAMLQPANSRVHADLSHGEQTLTNRDPSFFFLSRPLS